MYKDPSRWAMTFQSFVALTMLDMHRRPTASPVKLMERSLYSARHCFVEHMIRNGIMHPAESSVLDEWFRFIQQQIPIQADLIGKYEHNVIIRVVLCRVCAALQHWPVIDEYEHRLTVLLNWRILLALTVVISSEDCACMTIANITCWFWTEFLFYSL